MSGDKSIVFEEPLSVTKLKLMSKTYKTTLTTLTIALLGESIDKYFKENNTELDKINICVPFTLRGFTNDNKML
jgi:hypothetical protein